MGSAPAPTAECLARDFAFTKGFAKALHANGFCDVKGFAVKGFAKGFERGKFCECCPCKAIAAHMFWVICHELKH